MTDAATGAGDGPAGLPTAQALLAALRERGVGWVVGIPDNGSAALFRAVERADDVSLITVTREGEAIATACGLWLGGEAAVVVIQNTGLLESGDSLRGVAIRMGVPLLMLIGYRGHATLPQRAPETTDAAEHERVGEASDVILAETWLATDDAAMLVRPEIDSVAVLTEPTLRAWSIPYRTLDAGAGLPALQAMWDRAHAESRPAALLLTAALPDVAGEA